jgi:tRNA threonylcarbamoyladenosine biosynthesis protein TsaE
LAEKRDRVSRPQRLEPSDLAAFVAAAEAFAGTLRAGDVVALEGDLGSGKTTFVAAAARALGAADEVASPTFVFRHRYAGDPAVEHLDLYRLDDPREAVELGLHEALDSGAVTFVEWPDRLPSLIPPAAIRVRIEGSGTAPRTILVERP